MIRDQEVKKNAKVDLWGTASPGGGGGQGQRAQAGDSGGGGGGDFGQTALWSVGATAAGKGKVESEVSNGMTSMGWSETVRSLSSLEGLEQRSDKTFFF